MKKLLICFSLLFLILLPSSISAGDFETELLAQVNIYRMSRNLPALVPNVELGLLAYEFSYKLEQKNVFSHDIVSPGEWDAMAANLNIDRQCVELLVYAPEEYPNPIKSFFCLKNSPEHNKGMLMENGVAFGAAYVSGKGHSYATIYIGGPDRRDK